MTKVNYDSFASFDINECCDHFDSEKPSNWKKINKFIVADGQEFAHIMESEFDFEDTGAGEYEVSISCAERGSARTATAAIKTELDVFKKLAELKASAATAPKALPMDGVSFSPS